VLALSTVHPGHSAHSGYQMLASYLPNTEFLSTLRRDPSGILCRALARGARRLSFTRWYLGGCAVLEWQALWRIVAKRYGILHSLWADHDLGYLDLLPRRIVRLVGTFHNCSDTFPKTIRFPSRLRRFDAIILMSAVQADYFLGRGVPANKLHVIPHGVDTDYFSPIAQPQRSEFTVLSVGGYRRNFSLLVKICSALAGDRRIRFRIVGPRDYSAMFRSFANVEYRWGLSDEDLLAAYRTSSCFLLTAESATANNALLEAMACGLPVVTERVGGIPEYVNSQCASLVEPNDAEEAARSLTAIADAPLLAAEMGKAAHEHALTLNWARTAEATSHLYDTLLN
jgi:glycosyltransferase involved in cell wall biosynthesis